MQKIAVLIPDNLIASLERIAIDRFKATLNPSGTRIELSNTIRSLLNYAVENYGKTNPDQETLGALWGKFELIERELDNLKATISRLPNEKIKYVYVDNSSLPTVKNNDVINQLSYVDALLLNGFVEFSQESICHRFGWDISNENVQNNFKNLRQYANLKGIGEYSGWVVVSDNGNHRYFFKEY